MSKKCIKCGVELEDSAVFCDECGTQQVVDPVPPEDKATPASDNLKSEAADQRKNEGKNSGFGIVSLVAGIISICTLGMFFIPEILGLIFGIMGACEKSRKHVMAIGGIVMSAIALIFGIFLWIVS